MKIKTYYRISDTGYNKVKPEYVNNKNCLLNFINVFQPSFGELKIYADNTSKETDDMILNVAGIEPIKIYQGSSAQSFRHVFEKAIVENDENTVIYFLENDYIHVNGAKEILLEGIEMGADFCTLYDHPDKYMDADKGGNPEIEGGGEVTKVFKTPSYWFKLTNSTTMTFAATVKTLRRNEYVIRKHTSGIYPTDYQMSIELRSLGETLISPIPSVSTHGETAWLANPSVGKGNVIEKWKKIMEESLKKI